MEGRAEVHLEPGPGGGAPKAAEGWGPHMGQGLPVGRAGGPRALRSNSPESLQVGGLLCCEAGGEARGTGSTDRAFVQKRRCPSSLRGAQPRPGPWELSGPLIWAPRVGHKLFTACEILWGCVGCMYSVVCVCVCVWCVSDVCEFALQFLNLLGWSASEQ